MKVNQSKVTNNDKEIRFTYIDNNSDTICFMFSGAGYTYDKPLLYYSTMTMLQNNYDVVHIHYSYGDQVFNLYSLDEIVKMMMADIKPIITEVLDKKAYKHTVFLGKSLGTLPITMNLVNDENYINSKIVLLTPLLKFDSVVEGIIRANQPTLLVIGERDPHFIQEKIVLMETKKNLFLEKVSEADHSLDIEPFNTLKSTAVMGDVMKKLNDFLKIVL